MSEVCSYFLLGTLELLEAKFCFSNNTLSNRVLGYYSNSCLIFQQNYCLMTAQTIMERLHFNDLFYQEHLFLHNKCC